MKIRAFISIDIPNKTKREIKKIQEKLPEFKGKITEPENLHLTLKFLGWIDEEKIELIKKKLLSIRIKKFESFIDKVGFFYPRIIWLHMAGLDLLQKEIDEELSELFERERRFMSHLTIARIKEVRNWKKFREIMNKIKIQKIKLNVKNFRLKKSTLRRTGPIYEILEEYTLN